MENDKISRIKYVEFVNSQAYSLFCWIMAQEKQELVNTLLNENDKEKVWIIQRQIYALNNLELSIKGKTYLNNEEQDLLG